MGFKGTKAQKPTYYFQQYKQRLTTTTRQPGNWPGCQHASSALRAQLRAAALLLLELKYAQL